MCPYELALKLHELGVNSESEFYFVKEMKGGRTQIDLVTQNTMRYSYRKEGDLIPAYMSHELGEILPNIINISKSKIWDDWLQLTQYFPNRASAALIEAMGMMSENIERANRGESLAYTKEAFNKVVMNNGIDYNSVMSRSWI